MARFKELKAAVAAAAAESRLREAHATRAPAVHQWPAGHTSCVVSEAVTLATTYDRLAESVTGTPNAAWSAADKASAAAKAWAVPLLPPPADPDGSVYLKIPINKL